MATVLDAAAILAAADLGEPVPVEVPEWGGTVYVRELSGGERDHLGARLATLTDDERERYQTATIVGYCLCDSAGAMLLPPERHRELADKSARALARVFDVACAANGISAAAQDAIAKK